MTIFYAFQKENFAFEKSINKKIVPGLNTRYDFSLQNRAAKTSFAGHPVRQIHPGASVRGVQPEFVRILQTVLQKELL